MMSIDRTGQMFFVGGGLHANFDGRSSVIYLIEVNKTDELELIEETAFCGITTCFNNATTIKFNSINR